MLRVMLDKNIVAFLRGELGFNFRHLHRIKEVSLYVLSKDNFDKRNGNDETLEMIREVLAMLIVEVEAGKLQTVIITFVGEIDLLPADMRDMCLRIRDLTRIETHRDTDHVIRCTLAMVYDPVDDCKKARDTETGAQSPIDLVVRTGGELRSSGFFPLHTLYSEWVYLTTLFPDLTLQAIDDAIHEYLGRHRRFGA